MLAAPDRTASGLEAAQAGICLASALASAALFTTACGMGAAQILAWLVTVLVLLLAGFVGGRVCAGMRISGAGYAVAGAVLCGMLGMILTALLPGLRLLHGIFFIAPPAVAVLALTAGLFHQPWGPPLNFGACLLLIYLGLLKADEYHPFWFPLASFLWMASLHVERTRRAWMDHPDRPAVPAAEVMRQSAGIYACLAALFIPFWILSLARVDAPDRTVAAVSGSVSLNTRMLAILAGVCYAALVWMIARRVLRGKRAMNKQLAETQGWDGDTRVEAGVPPRGRRIYEESGMQGRVIQDYAQFLGRLRKAGRAREESQTPRELTARLAAVSPECSSPLAEVTRVYEAARYGFDEIEMDEYARFQENLEQLNSVAP